MTHIKVLSSSHRNEVDVIEETSQTANSRFTIPLISGSFEYLALFSNGEIYLSRDERAL